MEFFNAFLPYLLFVIGFMFLIKGADLLVDGGSGLAKRYNISNIVIGLTIVAFGSSAPELIVSLLAAVQGSTELAVGNVIGSNIANILLILGVSALIYPLIVHKNTVWKEIPFSVLGVVVLAIMANDIMLDGDQISVLTRIDGLILLSMFVVFMYYTFGIARQSVTEMEAETVKRMKLSKAITLCVFGLVGLAMGGYWIVEGAKEIARGFNISEQIIGLTIVAFGTSLPELATSAVAAKKKETDIAVGNVIGSNIFNIFWILGLSATVAPLTITQTTNLDLFMLLMVSLMLFLLLFVGRRGTHYVERWHGATFIVLYLGYMTYLFIAGTAA